MRRAIIIAAVLAAGAAGAFDASPLLQFVTAQSFNPLSLGPVAWYRGEGNALNSAGTTNASWVTSGEAYSTGIGQCFDFTNNNGTVGYITCNASLLPETNNFTMAYWVYATATNEQCMVSQFLAGDAKRMVLSIRPVTMLLGIQINGRKDTTLVITPSAWNHITIVREYPNFSVYKNGVLVETFAKTDGIIQTEPTRLAAFGPSGASFPFKGKLDEVIVVRRALTQSEITQLYNWRQ
jgi:hypothetical protein